jgi:hypothetical protein
MKRRGELIKLNALFDKYKNHFKAPQQSVIDGSVDIIEDVLGFKIDAKKCTYTVSTRTLATGAPALIRQEIARHQPEIIAHLKGRLGEQNAPYRVL